jgi:hypothetical protein
MPFWRILFSLASFDSITSLSSVPVVTEIYRDPANAFLEPLTVVFLARDKLSGEDIGTALLKARKEVLEKYEAAKNLNSR